MRDIKILVSNNRDDPRASGEEFESQLQIFSRLLCTRAETYKTCKNGKCRRFKICMGHDRGDVPESFRFKSLPQCVQKSKENHDAMRLQVPKIMAEIDAMAPDNGSTYLSFRPPKRHRSRQ